MTKSNLKYEFISAKEFSPIFKENRTKVFSKEFNIDIEAYLSEEERKLIDENAQHLSDRESLHVICKNNNEVVGWSYGFQLSAKEFYMCNSAVIESYRKQGVYTKMMELITETALQKGFQKISSKHRMTNNAIIIPKLKFGFTISGVELSPTFGTFVNLVYYPNDNINRVLKLRDGTIIPTGDDLKHLF